jgi:hypothetical protein
MKREIHVDLLGLSHLLQGVKYLLFPASAGIDLLRTLVEAEVQAEAIEAQIRERPCQGRQENTERER